MPGRGEHAPVVKGEGCGSVDPSLDDIGEHARPCGADSLDPGVVTLVELRDDRRPERMARTPGTKQTRPRQSQEVPSSHRPGAGLTGGQLLGERSGGGSGREHDGVAEHARLVVQHPRVRVGLLPEDHAHIRQRRILQQPRQRAQRLEVQVSVHPTVLCSAVRSCEGCGRGAERESGAGGRVQPP